VYIIVSNETFPTDTKHEALGKDFDWIVIVFYMIEIRL
jgi:hypothetical protein